MLKSKHNKAAKKQLLKKIVGSKIKKNGASPFKMDNGLGNLSNAPSGSEITGGAGSNLGVNGIF